MRRLGVTAAVLIVVWVVANVFFVWFPRTDSPAKADVVFVIAGANEDARVDEGIRLVQQGYAPLMVTDDHGVTFDQQCHGPVRLVCFKPDPNTTQGEARVLAAMASQRGWHAVLLVVSKDQASRARIRIRRCYDGGLRVVAVPIGDSAIGAALYQDAATLKAEIFQRGC